MSSRSPSAAFPDFTGGRLVFDHRIRRLAERLKVAPDGRVLVSDYINGLLELDRQRGTIRPLLGHRNSESFRGCNDLHIATKRDIYFTDQGLTGLHDRTGRAFRLCPDGRIDCLISNGPGPNGLVLSPDETVMYVAMTRDNCIWRVPLMRDGVGKVGRFSWFFATSGPDGLTVDQKGRLFVAHDSLGHVFGGAKRRKRSACIQSCAGWKLHECRIGRGTRRIAHYGIFYRISVMADLAHLPRNSPAGVARWCGIFSRAGPPHQAAGMSVVDDWLASRRENVIGDEWMAFVCGDLKPEPVIALHGKRKRRIRNAGSGSARNGPPPTCRLLVGRVAVSLPTTQND
ncbi:SMP-30/gluconolactonase/LRE family protein [Bradyrhizobium sp. WSM471]|uniref:SMP-30/gluconolactonase/LRE family protein n=1 Tax=Bradyrhizobium sp. WSM471 TaxID=319017 RepID=UPI002692061C